MTHLIPNAHFMSPVRQTAGFLRHCNAGFSRLRFRETLPKPGTDEIARSEGIEGVDT